MVTDVSAYGVLLALVSIERVNELRLSRRNARSAFAEGGVEVGQRHYRVMVVLHSVFLASCLAEVVAFKRSFPGALGWFSLAIVLASQGLRAWAITSLGVRWNTRVIIVPGAVPVSRGPYRVLRHPNYLAVVLEIAFLPLVHGAWLTSLVFSAANAALLAVRIRTEEKALGTDWATIFANRSRFIPGVPHA